MLERSSTDALGWIAGNDLFRRVRGKDRRREEDLVAPNESVLLQPVSASGRVIATGSLSRGNYSVNSTGLTIEEVQAAEANNATASEHSNTSNAPSSLQESTSSIPDSKVEPRTLSFAELKELIEQGKTDQIPNNRVIPNDLSVCLEARRLHCAYN